MTKSKVKLQVTSKFNVDQLNAQALFATNPEAVLPLLSMIGQAQLSIDWTGLHAKPKHWCRGATS